MEHHTLQHNDEAAQQGGPWNVPATHSGMTIADFVERAFVPEHVAMKRASGQTHYQAILKHVLTPEGVESVFHAGEERLHIRLKAVPDWPYLDNVRLRDARPDHVQRLIEAALAHGYSTQTAKHIRSVVSAIFVHAMKKGCFQGENPAGPVALPKMTRKDAPALTLAQVKEVLAAMQHPEKEMTLMAILTGMNGAEICGLQWKRVNLTDGWREVDGEAIPPRTIAVRQQWYRGELCGLNAPSRLRNLPIPEPLLAVLMGLARRAAFRGPGDFVLVSRAGTPINRQHIAARRLKSIGLGLRMPWLSWHVFHRTHTALAYQLGIRSLDMIMRQPDVNPSTARHLEHDPEAVLVC
jgi:integrase